MENTTDFKSFNYQEDGTISFSILATKFSTSLLTPGIYDLKTIYNYTSLITKLQESNITEDFELNIPQKKKKKIQTIYDTFYCKENKTKINNLGYNHKTGILLYGKQGTGKTSILKKYFKKAVEEQNAIVFNITSLEYFGSNWEFIKGIRKIQDNPIIIFMDEFEDIFEKYKSEDLVKRAMDGFDSIDNCFFMLTTNYIDKIPDTIKNRPSRVKYSIEIEGIQEEILISNFLRESFEKINFTYDFSKNIKDLKGSTIDDLKQFVIDKILDIETLNNKSKKIGFT